jgi:hypothetical protein
MEPYISIISPLIVAVTVRKQQWIHTIQNPQPDFFEHDQHHVKHA